VGVVGLGGGGFLGGLGGGGWGGGGGGGGVVWGCWGGGGQLGEEASAGTVCINKGTTCQKEGVVRRKVFADGPFAEKKRRKKRAKLKPGPRIKKKKRDFESLSRTSID